MTGRATDLRCLIVDDHPPILRAVSDFLATNGVEVVAAATTIRAALRLTAAEPVEVAVVDLRLPDGDGLELARTLLSTAARRVVLYTAEASSGEIRDALAAGVHGIVRKDAPLDDLLRAITAAARGQAWLDPSFTDDLLGPHAAPALSEREREILTHLADGHSHTTIAAQLKISTETVRAHLHKAMRKLEAPTTKAAIAEALRRRIIR